MTRSYLHLHLGLDAEGWASCSWSMEAKVEPCYRSGNNPDFVSMKAGEISLQLLSSKMFVILALFISFLKAKAFRLQDSGTENEKLRHRDLLKHLRDPLCEGISEAAKTECFRDELLGAFAKDLQKRCVDESDFGKEAEAKTLCQAVQEAEEDQPGKLGAREKIKEVFERLHEKLQDKEMQEDLTSDMDRIAEIFNISLRVSSEDAVPILVDGVDLINDLMHLKFDTAKDIGIVTLKASQLALKIAGSLVPLPGVAFFADKLIGFAIDRLAEEAHEELDEKIDRIASEAIHQALSVQKLREAKIYVDAADRQVRFQTSLDTGWDHLVAEQLGTWSNRGLARVLQSETSFNRYLIIENALAAAIPRLFVPERSDASADKDGQILEVEDRAQFMNVILNHYLLYILVLGRMDDRSLQDVELRRTLVQRAQEMAKDVMPQLAVMWEKQWGNIEVQQFFPHNPESRETFFRCQQAMSMNNEHVQEWNKCSNTCAMPKDSPFERFRNNLFNFFKDF